MKYIRILALLILLVGVIFMPSPAFAARDKIPPTVNNFTALTPTNSLSIPITAFTASDDTGVTGYLITESAAPPLDTDPGWTATAPASYTVAAAGAYTLYPWAKDAAGNISAVYATPAAVVVDTTLPVVDSFGAPGNSSSWTIPITAFTASDAVGLAGYLITQTSTPPLVTDPGWTAGAPGSYSVTSDGSFTLYPWAKDTAGNVSAVFASPAAVLVDTLAPSVDSFSAATPTNSLVISITAFTASDAGGVTGYLIGESVTPPPVGDAGWSATAPTSYTVASDGSYTLHPWAKDAAGNVSAAYGSPLTVLVDSTAPSVTIDSITPNPTAAGTTVTWHAGENGTYSLRLGGTDCSSGTEAASGAYSTSPATVDTVIDSGSLLEGSNAVYVCVSDALANSGFATGTIVKDTPITPPGDFGKTSPANAADNQIPNPVLSWAASAGATSYEYCISRTSECTSWIDNGLNTSVTVTGLYRSTTYYWHVRALKVEGLKSATTYADGASTSIWSFTTKPAILRSIAPYDGWILETAENSTVGGTMNQGSTTLLLGDDGARRQYRAILSFNTDSIPDNALITSVVLKFKYESVSGTNPFTTHGNLLVDIRKGLFGGDPALQLTDFQAPASLVQAMSFTNILSNGWYIKSLAPSYYNYISKTGVTQLRLRFASDDDNDSVADILRIFSGNDVKSNRPVLLVRFTVPLP